MWKVRDPLVSLATDAENMHEAALRHGSFGERAGKRAAAGNDGERARPCLGL
jgi:hypothetical protein